MDKDKKNTGTKRELTFEKLWESEESLRVLMDSNPEAVFILDLEGNFVAANEKSAVRFGKSVKELIGTNVYSYLSPDIAKKRRAKVEEVISTRMPVRFDDTRNNRYYDNYLHPILDTNGNLIRIAVWVIDFTERKKAVDALRTSEEKFRELAENIGDIFWIRKGDEMIYVSPGYETICGKSSKSLYENPNSFLEAILPDDLPKVMQSYSSEQYMKDGLFNEEFRILHPDGTIKWIWSKSFPVKRDGEIIRTVGIAEDITLRKKAEQDIQNALIKERELNELKSRFISMVSHEFRTPLGLILSSAELLEKYGGNWDNEKKAEHLDRIKKSVINLTGLVEDVLIENEKDAGRIKPVPANCDLILLMNEMIKESSATLENHLSIIFNPPVENLIIISDEKLLRQILLNLFSNAVKYTPADKEINIEVSVMKDKIVIEVRDEGIGIPQNDLNNIFEPFARGTNVGKTKGSGLGLSIAKHAIELLKGKIKVDSKINEGTVFSVTLPQNITL